MGDRAGFRIHRWEGGVFAGAYAGATLISAYGALSVTDNLKIEADALAVPRQRLQRLPGRHRPGARVHAGVAHLAVRHARHRRISASSPRPRLAQPIDRNDQLAYAGVGLRLYLTRRFFLRGEYRTDVVFTKTNSNEVNPEWRLGFAFFY